MKKRYNVTKKDVRRWINQGFGQGEGESYKPFFHVRDVPSRGRSTMIKGLKSKRTHHYYSDLERRYHLLAEHDPEVTEIREQFALLPHEKTQEIAKAAGLKHPSYPGSRTPIVMTSDLVLTVGEKKDKKLKVWSIKPQAEIDPDNPKSKRTLEKLFIEKAYWSLQGVKWELKTDRKLPTVRARNLDALISGVIADELNWLDAYFTPFMTAFQYHWNPSKPLNKLMLQISDELKLEVTDIYKLIGRAVWNHQLPLDLDKPLHYQLPVFLTNTNGDIQ